MPPGRTASRAVSTPPRPARTAASTGPSGRLPVAARVGVGGEDLVAAVAEHGGEQVADEAVTDDEDTAPWHLPGTAQDAGERLHHRAGGLVHVVRQLDPSLRAYPLGEAAGPDRRLGEAGAERLVAGAALLAGAAGVVVDERDAAAVRGLGDDLVPEHGARRRAADLLHVRAAQPAGEHAHEIAGPVRLGDVGEPGLALRP